MGWEIQTNLITDHLHYRLVTHQVHYDYQGNMVRQCHAAAQVLVLWCYMFDLLMKQFTLLAHKMMIDLAKHEICSKMFPNLLYQVIKYNIFFFVMVMILFLCCCYKLIIVLELTPLTLSLYFDSTNDLQSDGL